ncbi:MAG: PEP-utilizing enzyme [Candidatus Micrarchaeota archaeon]
MSWFNAGRWIQPPLSSGYWHSWQGTKVFEELGLPKISGAMMILDGYFIYEEKEINQLVSFGLEKINKDVEWFKEFFKLNESSYKNLKKVSIQAKTMTPLEGWVILDKPMRELFTLWTLAYLQFDHALNKAFHEFSVKHHINEAELTALVKPSRRVRVVSQQIEARKLKKKILEIVSENELKNGEKVLEKIKAQAPDLYLEIQKHLEKFSYIGVHHFWGEPLSFEKILDMDITEKIAKTEPKIPKDAEELVKLAGEIAFWRQYLAETTGVVAFNLMPFFKQSAREIGINEEDYMYLADFEYIELFKSKKKINPSFIFSRKEKNGMVSDGKNAQIITNTELDKKLNEVLATEKVTASELKGTVACSGKAIGKVKIILVPTDIAKIEAGDIMVAPETAPDFVAAMRKCVAIVTNQGGVTSHAAIVSRELQIPCIVGTKNATNILKDGDIIEVDAVKGIIRIVKKNVIGRSSSAN